jgi:magnesium-transporting ATPase (P-type)
VKEDILKALNEADQANTDKSQNCALVIEGSSLHIIQANPDLNALLNRVSDKVSVVIACRVSPS